MECNKLTDNFPFKATDKTELLQVTIKEVLYLHWNITIVVFLTLVSPMSEDVIRYRAGSVCVWW